MSPSSYELPPARRRSSKLPLLLAAVVLGVGLLIAGTCGGLMMLGGNVLEEQIAADLEDNEVLREHLGEIVSFEVDWSASMDEEDPDTMVYEVEGTRASGTLKAQSITIDADTEEVVWGVLELESGETYDILPEAGVE